jgi:hypothetical protein
MPKKHIISGNDFVELLANENSLSNYIIEDEVIVNTSKELRYNNYSLENIEFKDRVKVNLEHSNIEFTFINNQFKKVLHVSGTIGKMVFSNSEISGNLIIEGAVIDKEIIEIISQ